MTSRYNFRESEPKWQQRWQEKALFSAASDKSKPKYYVLEMFPYPSGNIHMGHVRNYTLGDVLARYKRACGFSVLHPMGWDAFGLPAENAAMEKKIHPAIWTYQNINTMREQLRSIGLSYDWEREFATCHPDYYRHEQKFFLELWKKGLAYRKESLVNWDPVDQTVLANEQVVDGKGWRSGAPVERKTLSQWFLRITHYAEDLLASIEKLDGWPARVRTMQEKWIGRSEGAMIRFVIEGLSERLEVYTTRPDTIFGMSFCGISPNHPLATRLAAENPEASSFIGECARLGTSEEAIEKAEKRGFDTGLRVRHPFLDQTFPVYIANFVLMEYGTGAIFGCPAHDQRDLDFARKYGLEVTTVVSPKDTEITVENEAYTGPGHLIHSDFLNGMETTAAKREIIRRLEKDSHGEGKINFRLRDWGISRQRYWGCPIPVIHCASCGIVAVPEHELPVTLPEDVSFDKPGNPLEHHPNWKHTACPDCGKPARRETDTFDTFFESSWYFARFCSPHAPQGLDRDACAYWMPVDCYIGGIEHAVLHLLYARFFTRALRDLGYLEVSEPFTGQVSQGMVCHETYRNSEGKWISPDELIKREDGTPIEEKTGHPVMIGRSEKMSKSKKNTVDPRRIIEGYGADTARLFMLSDSPPDRDLEWTDAGIEGAWRYLNRIWRLLHDALPSFEKLPPAMPASFSEAAQALRKKTHATIDGVTKDIEAFHYNKAIARIRELTNLMGEEQQNTDASFHLAMREAFSTLIILLAPFTPHLAEEMWEAFGGQGLAAEQLWPVADKALLVEETITFAIQVNGKMRGTMELARETPRETVEKEVLAQEKIRDFIEGREIRKIIIVPGRLVNVVTA